MLARAFIPTPGARLWPVNTPSTASIPTLSYGPIPIWSSPSQPGMKASTPMPTVWLTMTRLDLQARLRTSSQWAPARARAAIISPATPALVTLPRIPIKAVRPVTVWAAITSWVPPDRAGASQPNRSLATSLPATPSRWRPSPAAAPQTTAVSSRTWSPPHLDIVRLLQLVSGRLRRLNQSTKQLIPMGRLGHALQQ
jgi:hypothetical protein